MRESLFLTGAFLLAFAGCRGEADHSRAVGAVIDTLPDGRVETSNPEAGSWRPEEAWALVPELQIGSAMAEGPDLFGNVTALAVDDLGRIYVADAQSSDIRVFAEDGKHLRTLGREGSGPGEFRQIQGMAWGPDQKLWIVDGSNGFVVYDTTGVFERTHPRNTSFSMFPWPGRLHSDGSITDVGGGVINGTFERLLVRHSKDFTRADTIPFPASEAEQFELRSTNGNMRMSAYVPFTHSRVFHIDDDGYFWTGITDQYRIHRLSAAGDTIRTIERQFTPVPVTAADREEAGQNLQFFIDQGGVVDLSRIPESKPAFMSMFTDDEDYLWVQPWSERTGDGYEVDVFDPDGRYLGQLATELRIFPSPTPVVVGNQFITVVRDDLDVPIVWRFRIAGRD